MNRRSFVGASAAAATLIGRGASARAPASPLPGASTTVPRPEVLRSEGGVLDITLRAMPAVVDMGAAKPVTTCTYDGIVPGYTWEVAPGDTLRVNLVNDLPPLKEIGPVDELRDLVQPLLDAATPTKQVMQAMPYWAVQRMIATAEPEPHSFGDLSRYAAEPIPDDTIAAMVDFVVDSPYRTDDANGSIWSLAWVGGDVINSVPRDATAYVHRGVTTLLRPTTVWPNGETGIGDELNGWTADVIETLEPVTLAESYQNFPNRMIDDWEHLYFGENYDRLVDVKTQYDPANLFNNPQSIQPRS